MLIKSRYLSPLFVLVACSQPSSHIPKFGQSFEVIGKDTFNVTDNKDLKQGKWYIIDYSKQPIIQDTLFYKDGVLLKDR